MTISRARWFDSLWYEYLEGRIRRWPPWQKPPRGTLLNKAHPLARGLTAAYLFNEGAGLPFDLSGNGRHGAAIGGATQPTWIATPYGLGLYFNGTTDRITLGTWSVDLEASLFMILKIYGGVTGRVCGFNNAYEINVLNTEYIDYDFLQQSSGNHPYPNLTWYSIGLEALTGGSKNIYTNGILTGTQGTDTSYISGLMYLGDSRNLGSEQRMEVACLYAWDRRLRASEIQQLHREPYGMFL